MGNENFGENRLTENVDTAEHYQMVAESKKQREIARKKYLEDSKTRLSNIQKKKMQTTFIGAISNIENIFGFLWGLEKEKGSYSDDELKIKKVLDKAGFDEEYFEDLWEDLRNEILTNGNNQLRALQQEIELYTIYWERYQVVMPVKTN